MASVNDFPLNADVREGDEGDLAVDISSQGMTLGEWIQHLCSISKNVKVYEADFYFENMKLDIQSLRNVLPNLRRIGIHGSRNGTSEQETLNARNVLKAFIPYVEVVELFNVNLGENLSLQQIGIANLEILGFVHPKNFNFDFLFTLNAESCRIITDQMPLRDLNRFFKLWIKGYNPRLKELLIYCDTEIVPDCYVLLKGLRVEEIGEEVDDEDEDGELEEREQEEESEVESEEEDVEEVEESEVSGESGESDGSESETESDEELEDEEVGGEGKKFLIRNCRGINGQIKVKHSGTSASVTFNVSK